MAEYIHPLTQKNNYEHGNCDFCKQRDVKVKPLNCKRHFYCRTCSEFSPKFQRKDFQCRSCSERCRQLAEERLQKVDNFLDTETGGRKCKDVAVSVDGGNIITLTKENTNESDDDDLAGNNDEWEHLLQTLTKEKERKIEKPTVRKKHKPRLQLVPREMSFIKLVLPSAYPKCRETGLSSESSENTKRNSDVELMKRKSSQHGEEIVAITDTREHHHESSSEDSKSNMQSNSSEEERCSSPVKSPRKHRKPAWGWIPSSTHFTDTDDDNIELLTDIEAPPESPRFSDESLIKAEEEDSFWDF